ncbi:MAG TPA: glycoside hydrolase family 76 protein [Acidimicrobiia bacterium]|nr:glycoside hydrolase family 76 protein [Acidimicrobiia bacterium]
MTGYLWFRRHRVDAVEKANEAYRVLAARFPLDPSEFVWPYGQVLEAAIATDAKADVEMLLAGLAPYWDGVAYRSDIRGGDRFYDDNAWLGLAFVRLGRFEDAARIFRYATTGWDAQRGGVYWTEGRNRDRNTVSTAPNAQLAMHLHARTGHDAYRQWAQRMHDWVDTTLRDPADGLYWDHIDDAGVIERTKWSYNQGCMAGLKATLGMQEAAATIARATLPAITGQPLAFNAIFFRNARELDLGHAELTAYAATLATEYEDLLDQAAAVQLFALAAH